MSPTETAREHLVNGLTMLRLLEGVPAYLQPDVEAIEQRLLLALTKLEAPEYTFPTGYDPDLEERRGAASEPPVDYVRPGQPNAALRGQPIDDPNYSGE